MVHVVNADVLGGAPKAAFALNRALQGIGIASSLLVQRKFSKNKDVFSVSDDSLSKQKTNFRMLIDMLQMKIFTKTEKGRFSFGNMGLDISNNALIKDADVIHLHWINEGYLSINSIKELSQSNKPLIWTLHDMWGFTGGCHYSMGCERFKYSCGKCPYLVFNSEKDFSNRFLFEKNDVYEKVNISFITCSEWLAKVTKASFLLKNKSVTPIHNTLDINIYKPLDKKLVRQKFNLPVDKFIILFVALSTTEERKGFNYLKKSLELLIKENPEIPSNTELLILGKYSLKQLEGIALKVNSVGRVKNETDVAEYYNAADIFLAPSLEDNLPNTVLESLACGVPVIAFNIGGIPEMVEHKKNGYLANEKSAIDFMKGIMWAYSKRGNEDEIRINTRKKVLENFSPNQIANEHLSLYYDIINRNQLFFH